MAATTIVPDVLAEYGTATREMVARYLEEGEPRRHLWDLAADYPRRGGRMLRPSICIAMARVLGADVQDAIRVAAAVELLHNAFLVHDDVEDGSLTRRGRPTLNALHGDALAVNTGDALALLGLRALMDGRRRLGPRLTLHLLGEAERAVRESIEGQAIELGWQRDNATALDDGDYLTMVLKKTCWYTTIFPLRAGALVATARRLDPARHLRFGFFLGAAFQIQDDVLNLVGDEARYGKELAGDLWEGKRTLVLIHLLRQIGAADRARLLAFLGHSRQARDPQDVAWLRARIDGHDALGYAARVAHALAGAARHECVALCAGAPASRDRRFLEELPHWVLSRA